MATEKILNTRIQLKYDTLENWNASTFNLKKGEVAFVEVPTVEGATLQPIMFKVGTGDKKFSDLDWVSAKAADVYGWAKKSQADFETYVKGLINTDLLTAYYTKTETDALLKAITDAASLLAGRVSTLEGNYDVDKKLSVVISELEGKINAVDTGIMNVTGSNAISVTGEDEKAVALVIDPTSGNVTLSQSATGLKASVDLSNYALAENIPTTEEIESIAATKINTLIGAADDEGGETIQNIANLVDYVEKNAGDIAELVTNVGTANTNASNAVTVAGNANTTAGQALEKANEALEGAEGAAASAQAAATAQGKAEEAQSKAETAKGAAETAQSKAEEAQGKAEAAQGKAETAQQAAEAAQGAAEGSAGAAATSESNAATSAQTATEKAAAAATSESNAATSASQANTSAQQAATSAQNAQASAEAAATAEQEAIQASGSAESHMEKAEAARDEAQSILTQVTDAATGAQATANEAKNLATTANTNASNAVATANEAKSAADAALKEITTTENGGLKVTNKNQIDIDTNVVFVFNCGSATETI